MFASLNQQFISDYGSIQTSTSSDEDIYIEHIPSVMGGDVIKSIIYGGLDGIITTFAIICSSYASKLSIHTIMVLGFANVLADAISMGHGDYFSEKTELEYIKNQYKRQTLNMEKYTQSHINTVTQLYEDKYNIPYREAQYMATYMSKYKDLFIDQLMVLDQELLPPSANVNPYKNGITTFFSFLFFGCITLTVFILSDSIYYSSISTIFTLGLLGWTRSYFTNSNKCYSCILTICNGCISAGSAYGVSYALDYYLQ